MKSNKQLIKYLNSRENIKKLEFLLEQPIKFNINRNIDVFKETNSYLRTNVGMPNFSYNNSLSKYNSLTKTIELRKDASILEVVHEYTHFITDVMRGGLNFNSSYAEEGLARGVETYIAGLVGKTEKIENYALNNFEYLQVYLRLCSKKNEKPKEKFDKDINMKYRDIGLQALGNSILSLYKLDFGDDIYWQMLHDKFQLSWVDSALDWFF